MAQSNDPKTSRPAPSAPVPGLSRQDVTGTPSADRKKTSTPAPVLYDEDYTPKESLSGRLKTGWHSLLSSMKQQSETDEEPAPVTEPENMPAAKTETAPEEEAADLRPLKESYKKPSQREQPEKDIDREKRNFFNRFRLELIEADDDTDNTGGTKAKTAAPKAAAVRSSMKTEVLLQPEDIITVDSKEPEPPQTNVIYQAPPLREEIPPMPEPPAPVKEKQGRELPAFNIFEDFPDDKKSVSTDDTRVSDGILSAKTDKAGKDTISIPTAVRQNRSGNTAPPPVPKPEKLSPKPSLSVEPSTAAPVVTVQDVSLPENTIYNAQPAAETIPDEKNLTEAAFPEVTYHYNRTAPFIVMAGKFTKTLREEYEAVQKYRKEQAAKPKPVPAAAAPKQPTKAAADTALSEETVRRTAPVKPSVPAVTETAAASSETVPQETKGILPLVRRKTKERRQKKKQLPPSSPLSDLEQYEEIPDEPEEKPENGRKKRRVSRAEKQAAAKEKKARQKMHLRDFFGGEEEYDPEEEPAKPAEPKPLLDDYNEEKDADAIKTEITSNFQSVFARVLILLTASVASITAALLAQCTELFRETIHNGWLWYALISFFMFGISVLVSRNPIVHGLIALRHFRGNSDTAVAVASGAVAMQAITAVFTPDVYLNGTVHLYVPLVILALFCNAVGKLLIITRTHYNFNFLVKPYPKYAGKIFTDKQSAQKMTRELPVYKPLIGYTRRTRFAANFLQLSYAPDPIEKLSSLIAPWTAVVSVISGFLFGIIRQSFLGGLSAFALTACMSVPIMALIAVNLPLRRLCRSVLKSGAMITGYETVKQFCDTNAIMIDSSQLYPKGTVTLTGMRSFKQSKLKDALQAGAAIMYAVNGTMIHIFENIVQCSKDNLPRVDNVIYEDGKGLVGWIKDQRVLIGNRELLKAHNIEPPDEETEARHRRRGDDIIYISVSGELIAMFTLSYKTYKHIANELRVLEQSGVSFIVRTVDPNLTREKVAEQFGLFYRCITILPTGMGNICHDAISGTDDSARAYLITRGKLSAFAKAVSGCIKMKMGVFLSRIVQGVSVGAGIVLVNMIAFVSGFEKLGCMEMLIYIGFWSITSIITSMIKK